MTENAVSVVDEIDQDTTPEATATDVAETAEGDRDRGGDRRGNGHP